MKNINEFLDDNILLTSIEGVDGFIEYDLTPTTTEGQLLDLSLDSLLLEPERLRINFERVPTLLREHAKAYISSHAAKWANHTLYSRFEQIVSTFKSLENASVKTVAEKIDETVRTFMEEKKSVSEKSRLRTFYGWCVDNATPFFDEDFNDLYLDTLVFGSDDGKGLDVRIRMPNRGPLTVNESRAFRAAIKNVEICKLTIFEMQGLVALKLGQVLGIRDVQVVRLQFKHFGCSEDGAYFIDVPRAKQRGRRKKEVTKRRPITASAATLIETLKALYERYEVVNGEWPLITNTVSVKGGRAPIAERVTLQTFYERRRAIEAKLDLLFKVTNRRLRKTFCTQLIAMGTPLNTVAELMDHSDLQQLDAYYMQTRHIAEKLDIVLLEEAKEILDTFCGKVVTSANVTNQGQEIFASANRKLHKIGSCASNKPCMLAPPLSCYGCSSLEAFIDADHTAVVENIVKETKKRFGEKHSLEILQSKEFLDAAKFVQKFEAEA
jgi:integrase